MNHTTNTHSLCAADVEGRGGITEKEVMIIEPRQTSPHSQHWGGGDLRDSSIPWDAIDFADKRALRDFPAE